jgi:peptidyl-prolyl cis-trans isomerase A (cyclophilin A)
VKRFVLSLIIALLIALVPATTPAQDQSTTPAPKTAAAAHPHPTAPHTDPALMHPATLTAKSPDVYEVTFKTTAGDFVVTVTRSWAPLGADRFYNLVKHGFFTDASFFRVVPGFIIQFGLSPSPAVNKVWSNAAIKDDPVTQSNHTGTLTFATSGPNTRTTQLFINLAENGPSLDGQGFSAFGQVTTGMDVVQKIYSGYGEMAEMNGHGPRAELAENEGKPYLDKNFPKLDHITSATVTSPAPPVHTTPAHKAAPAASKPAPAQQ